jgi:ectoine hydroxylase-related dioxygenase (phytanoyl-CoA dioxygenase family)
MITSLSKEKLLDKTYWLSICPHLHIGDERFQKEHCVRLKSSKLDVHTRRLDEEGYTRVDDADWTPKSVRNGGLAKAVRQLEEHGWPPTFLLMFDEAWAVIENFSDIMSRMSGGNRLNFDILVWRIDPNKDQAGFSPHRDRQPENVYQSFRGGKSGKGAKYTTMWLALTDANEENSCLYMIPKFVDPGYLEGDEFDEKSPLGTSEVGPIFRCLSTKTKFQHVRCVPANKGSAVVFTHRTIHWGSAGRKGYEGEERIAFSFAASDASFETPYLLNSDDILPFPKLYLRLALGGAQCVAYHDRFQFEPSVLHFFHNIYKDASSSFHSSYRAKIASEYMSGSETTSEQQKFKKRKIDEDEDSEDDIIDDALEAMLDAEIAGVGEFRDDFDDDY